MRRRRSYKKRFRHMGKPKWWKQASWLIKAIITIGELAAAIVAIVELIKLFTN